MLREITRKISDLLMVMRPGWLFCLIVLAAVVLSELICIALGLLLTGRLDPNLLWAGCITPLIDASIVGCFLVYLVSELRKARQGLEARVEERNQELVLKNRELEKEIEERKEAENQVRRINDQLDRRVKERTEDLKKAYEGLKRADELKDAFLSSVSHELRTPLTSIRSFAEILLQYDEEPREVRKEFMEIIRVESERLARLINDFLDLSKIEAGKMVYNDDRVPVEEIIGDVTKSQHQLLRERSLRLVLDISRDLPPVLADRDRIQQVVTNLLANAAKFSLEGGEIRVTAEVLEGKRSGDRRDWIKVSVSDQGVGIEEDYFEMIFDKFSQVSADTLGEKPSGTGLGLPICREIVSHYGGRIWVESRRGRGSTFSFTLPAGDLYAEAAGEGAQAAKAAVL